MSGDPKLEAAAWAAKLSRLEVSNADVRAFTAWLADEANDLEWCKQQAERRKRDRYVVRLDASGFSVVDIWTAEPAVLAMTPQTGLSGLDADETAALLNREARWGDRSVRQ